MGHKPGHLRVIPERTGIIKMEMDSQKRTPPKIIALSQYLSIRPYHPAATPTKDFEKPYTEF